MGSVLGRGATRRFVPWAQNYGAESAPAAAPMEMTPEVRETFLELAKKMKQTEQRNTMPAENSPEFAETRRRLSQLQRVTNTIPSGRLTETQLAECLTWRATKAAPPIQTVVDMLGPTTPDAATIARSLLLYYGTPQIVGDKAGARSGYWVATAGSTGIPLTALLPPDKRPR